MLLKFHVVVATEKITRAATISKVCAIPHSTQFSHPVLHERGLHKQCPVMHCQRSFEGQINLLRPSFNHLFRIRCNQFLFPTLIHVQLQDSIDKIRCIKDTMIKTLSTICRSSVSSNSTQVLFHCTYEAEEDVPHPRKA